MLITYFADFVIIKQSLILAFNFNFNFLNLFCMALSNIKNIFPEGSSLKNLIWWLLAFSLFFYGVERMVSAGNNLYNRGLAVSEHTISFSGEGKVKAAPDTARFEAGLVTEGKDSITVQNENSDKINKIIKYLKSRGVVDADIKTSQYNLSPKYDYIKGKTILSGYILNQSLTVTVRDIDKVGEFLDGAVANGANQINSVSMFMDNPEELKAKAREAAIEAARAKAALTASAGSFRLGRLIGFSESSGEEPRIFYEALGKGGGVASSPPQIEPGSQEITIIVNLTYQLR
ncbi:hypothetical protein A2833_03485 [Candidatus Azambacteria bacterium RIFCSPHIGHO2_01_FULL_44_55]|uniref:SIMPL domain-containing protein n=1 Tax=Candidatus Azambacteria bacterium RIFCSPLOWO2_02_FULL_44_14 TaxID=1797306 RepID=A0A1F5CBX5_9BACT|nr:MAG: hypothetical protein A3A18_03070 [Candidatus Azambacteria bacterium RIFCSPLOWO2_01_FULL_44_84]OGD33677.1 MAG: hypothetical protein A3C78_01150 [Candidatus Azambacteria bacterium RIFCSPHIGHO2_02_FULL_45_18]OGD40369.1 MAG: hypothetical protein A3I30_03725 [Candidatus Azambacteria bacterium RIFCSPLOWO2_02_FULL_44_14]OGD40812.1 MAG: hypothetical protein A2833_03485 [Candidatus Azambacteria bacterium RIFCSPHIGHO2_01_FULL_44_55]